MNPEFIVLFKTVRNGKRACEERLSDKGTENAVSYRKLTGKVSLLPERLDQQSVNGNVIS